MENGGTIGFKNFKLVFVKHYKKNTITINMEGKVFMKRRVSIVLSLIMSIGLTSSVLGAEYDVQYQESQEEQVYVGTLPDVFSYDVTIEEIDNDIQNYIMFNNMECEIGTDEYLRLMEQFSFDPPSNVDDLDLRYYQAYASLYLAGDSIEDLSVKTIGEIREENRRKNEMILENINGEAPIINSEQPSMNIAYNLDAAKDYAYAYALVNNYNYPEYGSDCTNFASQILHAGGFGTTESWNIWAGRGTVAWTNWVNAGGFLEYWSLNRGYLGQVCTTLDQVNTRAKTGDFLVWMETDTFSYYHTQFVQRKVNGYVYCTQHSPHYYNEKLSGRINDPKKYFENKNVYIVKFS